MTTIAEQGTGMAPGAGDDGRVDAADEEMVRQLAERARAEGLSLTGPGGLLGRLTKVVLEGALEGEMDAHLGYARNDPAGRDGGNSRNGKRAKTVITDVGPVQVQVPRDRDASFEPRIVAKRQRRLGGVDEMVISLVAKGLTTGEVQAHLAEIYGVEVSRETISKITDRVLEGLAEWSTPLCPKRPPWTRSPSSAGPVKPATPRSSGSGRTPGPSSCRSWPSTTRSARSSVRPTRVPQRPVPPVGQGPGPLPNRAGRPQAPLPHGHQPRPHRTRPQAMVQPVESRAQRLRHHLRRPPQRRPQVTTKTELHR
jgi:hypothetical protein